MSSVWFDYSEPSRTTSSQGEQGAYTLVPGGSTTANLLEPSQTTSKPSLTASLQWEQDVYVPIH